MPTPLRRPHPTQTPHGVSGDNGFIENTEAEDAYIIIVISILGRIVTPTRLREGVEGRGCGKDKIDCTSDLILTLVKVLPEVAVAGVARRLSMACLLLTFVVTLHGYKPASGVT